MKFLSLIESNDFPRWGCGNLFMKLVIVCVNACKWDVILNLIWLYMLENGMLQLILIYANIQVCEIAYNHLFEIEPMNASNYIGLFEIKPTNASNYIGLCK